MTVNYIRNKFRLAC